MLETAGLIVTQPSAQAERIGVYVLSAIIGLLVCGLIAIAKELRAEAVEAR